MSPPSPVPQHGRRSGRRISVLRVLVALSLIAGGAFGGLYIADRSDAAIEPIENQNAWSAPYVDVTIVPRYPFEGANGPINDVVLAFVVARNGEPCTPAWGALFDLTTASAELDLDRRLARLRQTGRDAVISFGGAINDELATVCTDHEELVRAYADVVERYGVSTIDLDLEGDALADVDAHHRRGAALAELQQSRQAAGHDLAIWLTLPATPQGLLEDGVAAMDATLNAGVEVAGINLMVMNFGESRQGLSMSEAAESSLEAGAQQVLGAWRRAGLTITPTEAWARLGATPMIGRNDIVNDEFTLSDARALTELVNTRGVGRLSYWSLNRDRRCGPNDEPLTAASDHCTHIDQDDSEFASVFGVISGSSTDAAGGDVAWAQISLLEDDPEHSPYPIWQPDIAFSGGEKTVWHGYVYEAKWWSEGNNPEAPVVNAWDTPWRIVGPVLAEDLVEPVFVPPGLVDAWDGQTVYVEGDRVWIAGRVFEAKWWNEGFQPNRQVSDEWATPWTELDPELFVTPDA